MRSRPALMPLILYPRAETENTFAGVYKVSSVGFNSPQRGGGFQTRPYLPAKAMYPSLPNPEYPHVAVLVDLFERSVEAGVELLEIPRRTKPTHHSRERHVPCHDTGTSPRTTIRGGNLIPSPVRGRGLEPAPLQNGGEGIHLINSEPLPSRVPFDFGVWLE